MYYNVNHCGCPPNHALSELDMVCAVHCCDCDFCIVGSLDGIPLWPTMWASITDEAGPFEPVWSALNWFTGLTNVARWRLGAYTPANWEDL